MRDVFPGQEKYFVGKDYDLLKFVFFQYSTPVEGFANYYSASGGFSRVQITTGRSQFATQ